MASFLFLIGFYLGGFFYVSCLVRHEEGPDTPLSTVLVSGALWPLGLYEILTERE